MPRPIVNGLAILGALALIVMLAKILTYETEPHIQQRPAVDNQPAPPPPPTPAPRARTLRDFSGELISIDAAQFQMGIWTALMTIENKTDQTLRAYQHTASCVLFDAEGLRVGMTLPMGPSVDLDPGETFSQQIIAAGIPTDRPPARYECLFQS